MAKKRGSKGGARSTDREHGSESEVGTSTPGVDPALLDQAALGNAVLQARMEGIAEVAGGESVPDLEVVASAAELLVSRGIQALQLDASDADALSRRVGILERSHLPEKEALIEQLRDDETARTTVDGLLDQHFGGHDAEARAAVDGVLDDVRQALLDGVALGSRWTDARGSLELSEGTRSGSLDARSQALITDLAGAHASEDAAGRATSEVGTATASLVRSLALMVLLDEEEEEELDHEYADVEVDG